MKQFNVTDQSDLTASQETVTRGGNITLSGNFFPESAALTPVWFIRNETWSDDISDHITDQGLPVQTLLNGTVNGFFDLPFDITRGKYGIICSTYSDDDLLLQFAELKIRVTYDVLNVSTRMPIYHLGDTLAFDINALEWNTSFALRISDPEDELYWICSISPGEWIKRGARWVLPIYNQLDDAYNHSFRLPNDGVTGDWTWIIESELRGVQDSGVFKVDENRNELILGKLSAIYENLTNISAVYSGFEVVTSSVFDNISLLQEDIVELMEVLYSYDIDELDNALDEMIVGLGDHNQTFNILSVNVSAIDRTLNETISNLNRIDNRYSEVESTYDEMSSMYNDKFIRNTLERSLILSFVSTVFLVLTMLRLAGMLIINIRVTE
jgi:hypothetical protein